MPLRENSETTGHYAPIAPTYTILELQARGREFLLPHSVVDRATDKAKLFVLRRWRAWQTRGRQMRAGDGRGRP